MKPNREFTATASGFAFSYPFLITVENDGSLDEAGVEDGDVITLDLTRAILDRKPRKVRVVKRTGNVLEVEGVER